MARTWLLTLVADQARKSRRRIGRRREEPIGDHGIVPTASLERDLDVERAVARLSDRQRLAVGLYYYFGLPITEVATVMKCADGTVKSMLADARARRWVDRQPAPPALDLRAVAPSAASPWRVRLLVIAACFVVIVAAVAASWARSGGPADRAAVGSHGPRIPDAVRDRLIGIVEHDAQPDRGTITAQAVETTYARAEAVALHGDTNSDPQPDAVVWLVQVGGHFDCGGCKGVPPGFSSPHGSVVTLIVTTDTYDLTDYALGDRAIDLEKLGSVTDLID